MRNLKQSTRSARVPGCMRLHAQGMHLLGTHGAYRPCIVLSHGWLLCTP